MIELPVATILPFVVGFGWNAPLGAQHAAIVEIDTQLACIQCRPQYFEKTLSPFGKLGINTCNRTPTDELATLAKISHAEQNKLVYDAHAPS